ncbi:histidine kinase [Massilia terrae]|uniref:Histidine kinase n=1 Tax=Massilia terrae TaxID=1811224 RepID=A0ABT2D2L8_9BURK|nr:histidine kinase [Massilia terrae]MCS0660472.1 histidine kinase [Massilia terrae]
MNNPAPSRFALDPMWRIYAAAWLGYALFIGFVAQLEGLARGQLNWMVSAKVAWGVLPEALLLALVWPLTGWLQRRQGPRAVVFAVHAIAGLASATVSTGLMWLSSEATTTSLVRWVWPFLYSLMIYIVVAVAFYLVRMSRAAQRHALAFEQAQGLLVAAELDALRSKLNPHFLFNTLHSIIALTRKDPRAAEAALFRFSDMLRYVLDTEKNGSDRVTVDDELDFVRDYLDLEALRLGDRLRVDWDVEPEAGSRTLPPLTLQPLVENSIKHAFNPRSQPGQLAIRVALDAGQLSLSVSDDGPGADPAAVAASRGLGIRTVERRLRLGYGPRAAFKVDTAPGAGFRVALSVPVEQTGVAA